ncbi:hypothetical protein DPMN_032163 [Dreissena polymorpha]|uniref:Uncharacterized protein n=1 Tax=Dreissena polymorpha TaxID=45954 RepID=A0A9D4M4G7_DREPO|nr:hypothetical protein DPMN_032163 [Dreissena polymorpha]
MTSQTTWYGHTDHCMHKTYSAVPPTRVYRRTSAGMPTHGFGKYFTKVIATGLRSSLVWMLIFGQNSLRQTKARRTILKSRDKRKRLMTIF